MKAGLRPKTPLTAAYPTAAVMRRSGSIEPFERSTNGAFVP
jgi:hypothetical protein